MKIFYALQTAITGLKTNKTRSALTILGIVIGITAIMLVVALGEGAQNLVLGQISSLGSNKLFILPGREVHSSSGSLQSILSDSLKERDLDLLLTKANAPHVTKAMPIVFGSFTASRESEAYRYTIYGVTDMFQEMYDIDLESGYFFGDEEVESRSDVAIIGKDVKEKLFGTEDPVGQKIKIKNRNYRVIGLMPEKGQSSMVSFDDAIVVPYTSLQRNVMGIKHFNRIVIEIDHEDNADVTVKDIEATLRDSHNIDDPDKDDFSVSTSADIAEAAGTVLGVMTIFLTAVAAISLLVGGVGIMNIVLVSVTERTREIGLRKALGATSKEILTQFLLESVLLTSVGGFIGIILGTLFSLLASVIITNMAGMDWPFHFPWDAALIGFIVSAAIGLVFGLYPSKKASDLSPIEALRYE